MTQKTKAHSLLSDYDIQLFNAGKHTQLYKKLGSHPMKLGDQEGVYFAVYAPAALKLEVIGDFNYWNGYEHELNVRWDHSGIWEGFIPNITVGDLYKYRIYSSIDREVRDKADPFARLHEMPPKTASVVWKDDYEWEDKTWMESRSKNNNLNAPMSVYELHLGSWKKSQDSSRSLHYTELAIELVSYIKDMNYTHVEFLPVMEHPYYPSWGYLCTGYFAPSCRYGNPAEYKYLVDKLHQAGIGVFLDWVPAHFPSDDFALANFDGSKLFEHPDKEKGFHPDWNSLIFNFEREQVRSFLLSSAHFWCDMYHSDGLRVDAVASMLYLDYSRNEGEWSPNIHGGNEYLASIDFLKELNTSIYRDFPDIQMIAEESTAFPGVTTPVDQGGLGFGLKWMMGWMNDSLEYFKRDTIHRKYHHDETSRSLSYVFSENFLLPLSHDEVVHGKLPLIHKMPGDEWQKFANLRLLYLAMFTHPGQKLLFMGNDIGQTSEWNVNEGIPWHLLDFAPHKGINVLVAELNKLYREETSLYDINYSPEGFEWLEYNDSENTVLSYIRKTKGSEIIIVLNFSTIVLNSYKIGANQKGKYEEIFNSDEAKYWGSDVKNHNLETESIEWHNRPQSLTLNLPPLGGLILKKVTT